MTRNQLSASVYRQIYSYDACTEAYSATTQLLFDFTSSGLVPYVVKCFFVQVLLAALYLFWLVEWKRQALQLLKHAKAHVKGLMLLKGESNASAAFQCVDGNVKFCFLNHTESLKRML